METVRIFVFPTHIGVECSQYGDVLSGRGNIRQTLDKCKEFEFDKRIRKYRLMHRYYRYKFDVGQMVLPRHLLSETLRELALQNIKPQVIEGNVVTPRRIFAKMNPNWQDRAEQEETIKHLTNCSIPMRCSDLQTGFGKTYSALRAMCGIGYAALIICDGLVEQWVREILEKTLIPEKDICVLKGGNSVIRLMASEEKPSVIVASIDTLRSFAKGDCDPYCDLPSYAQFLEYFGIGTKIFDEFHLNFQTLVSIDLRSHVPNNLYLSATPKRSSGTQAALFKAFFPDEIIVGGGVYDKYVNVTFYSYGIEIHKETAFNTPHGYSHAKYEAYIENNGMVKRRYLESVIYPTIDMHYINKKSDGQKLLILCRTVSHCQMLQRYLEYKYDTLKVNTFTADDPEENLTESDIIVSTPSSCGTGKDIKKLRTVIQTCSISSEPLVEQILGRLRKLPTGETPEFVDIYNSNLHRHKAHYRTRSDIYKARALYYTEHRLM